MDRKRVISQLDEQRTLPAESAAVVFTPTENGHVEMTLVGPTGVRLDGPDEQVTLPAKMALRMLNDARDIMAVSPVERDEVEAMSELRAVLREVDGGNTVLLAMIWSACVTQSDGSAVVGSRGMIMRHLPPETENEIINTMEKQVATELAELREPTTTEKPS